MTAAKAQVDTATAQIEAADADQRRCRRGRHRESESRIHPAHFSDRRHRRSRHHAGRQPGRPVEQRRHNGFDARSDQGNFTVSEQEYLSLTRSDATLHQLELELVLSDGTVHPHKGRFSFADRAGEFEHRLYSIDRAVSQIPGNKLRPGQYGKCARPLAFAAGALLVPQRSVTDTQGNYLVAVIDPNNTIRFAPVQVGDRIGSNWVVDQRLKPGERVVTDGLFKIRPGAQVNPKPANMKEAK